MQDTEDILTYDVDHEGVFLSNNINAFIFMGVSSFHWRVQ